MSRDMSSAAVPAAFFPRVLDTAACLTAVKEHDCLLVGGSLVCVIWICCHVHIFHLYQRSRVSHGGVHP